MPKYLILILLLSNLRECLGVVLKGARAQEGQFPWLIQFHTVAPCGGVLVSPDWVLTAAQCVQYKRNSIELYAAGLNGPGSSQNVSVKATYIFPQFQAYSKTRDYDHNIALLKLEPAFDMCDGKVRLLDIAPVRLDDDYKTCLIFGWQSTVAPPALKVHAKPVQYSKVLLNSWRVCLYMHQGNASYKNVFCAMVEDENGIRACAGNPGSPVVCEDQYQRMVLLGIASWSNFSLDCGGLPTYLGVSVFRSWIWDLIFGSKNMEQWETGSDNAGGACQKERRPTGIYTDINLHPKLQNYTEMAVYSGKGQIPQEDEEDEEEEAYEMSWKPSAGRRNNAPKISTKRISGLAKITELRDKLEPPIFNEFDEYTNILGAEGPRRASDFDVVRERNEQLSQYREIGRGRNDRLDEPIAISSQEEKHTIIIGKAGRNVVKPGDESFDELELIMPDGIEDFDRSIAATLILFSNYFLVLLMSLCGSLNMAI